MHTCCLSSSTALILVNSAPTDSSQTVPPSHIPSQTPPNPPPVAGMPPHYNH